MHIFLCAFLYFFMKFLFLASHVHCIVTVGLVTDSCSSIAVIVSSSLLLKSIRHEYQCTFPEKSMRELADSVCSNRVCHVKQFSARVFPSCCVLDYFCLTNLGWSHQHHPWLHCESEESSHDILSCLAIQG